MTAIWNGRQMRMLKGHERGATIGGLHHGGLTWTKSPIVERGDSRKEPGARRAAVCAVSQLPSRPGRVCDAPGKVQGVLPARLGGATTQGPPALLKLKQSPANVQVTQNEEADDQFRQFREPDRRTFLPALISRPMLREHPATTTITTAIGRGSAIGRPAARNASIMLDREDPESRRSDPRPIVGATAGNDWLPAALPWRPDKLKLFGRLGRSPHQLHCLVKRGNSAMTRRKVQPGVQAQDAVLDAPSLDAVGPVPPAVTAPSVIALYVTKESSGSRSQIFMQTHVRSLHAEECLCFRHGILYLCGEHTNCTGSCVTDKIIPNITNWNVARRRKARIDPTNLLETSNDRGITKAEYNMQY
ncbi:hypothetical protein M432DRAFT_670888 [Thermoascus aurantiacus ATCC 26904]